MAMLGDNKGCDLFDKINLYIFYSSPSSNVLCVLLLGWICPTGSSA